MALMEEIKAFMGFAAHVIFVPDASTGFPNFRVRASNVGVQVKQEIQFPALIDGSIDRTAYQLMPKIVEGDIAFPLVHEGGTLALPTGVTGSGCGKNLNVSLSQMIWQLAAARTTLGRMKHTMDIAVVYPDSSEFVYPACQVNTASFKVAQSGTVDVTFGVVGGSNADRETRRSGLSGTVSDLAPTYLSPARIVTWNDFVISIYSGGDTSPKVVGDGIREFNCDINNGIDRYYTMNGSLTPQDIVAKKREIKGSIKLLGRSEWLNNFALGTSSADPGNEGRFTSTEHIAFGYKVGGASNIYWATALHGVIFFPEEMTVSPDQVFETTVQYQAAGDCSFDYEATELGTSGIGGVLAAPSGSNYGDKTRDGYGTIPSGYTGWEIG